MSYIYVGRCKHYSANHTKLNSSFISNCIINLVFENPRIPIKALVKEIESTLSALREKNLKA
ncbi:hypothetical protein Lal_00041754 [Lupinus albus]|nr:hypothetical protein Lal_00041754 [Lupinus albus]